MDIASVFVLRPPEDPGGLERVRAALEERKRQFDPQLGTAFQMVRICEIALLEGVIALLEDGHGGSARVNVYRISRELLNMYGESFYACDFSRACLLVSQVCLNGHSPHPRG